MTAQPISQPTTSVTHLHLVDVGERDCPARPCPIPSLEAKVLRHPGLVTNLDEDARHAERLAQVVELTREQWQTALPHLKVSDRREQLVAWTLENAAKQARLVATQHAQRCTRGEGEPCSST